MDLVYLSLCKMVSRYLKAVSRSFTQHTRSRYYSAPAIKGLCLHFLSHGAPEVLDITRKFMNKPVRILMKPHELTLEGISNSLSMWKRQAGS
ncbi:hypothetical protein LguiA_025958 [Lonicera macranthoides]